jgi:hypothetical protein
VSRANAPVSLALDADRQRLFPPQREHATVSVNHFGAREAS